MTLTSQGALSYHVAMNEVADELLARIRVVLIETSHPGNIGGAARAMKTMGLTSLVLVSPKRFPDPQAEWRAAGAIDVIDAARVVATLDEAIADCSLVIGTSTRQRSIPWPLLSARECAAEVIRQPVSHQVAILFGREASGLSNEELQRCHQHLQIPTHPDYPSLNLAMAVQVVSYELFQAVSFPAEHTIAEAGAVQGEEFWDREPATIAEMENFFQHFQKVLTDIGFLDPENPRQALPRLRRLFTRIQPDETEIKMLRGILKQVQRSQQ